MTYFGNIRFSGETLVTHEGHFVPESGGGYTDMSVDIRLH